MFCVLRWFVVEHEQLLNIIGICSVGQGSREEEFLIFLCIMMFIIEHVLDKLAIMLTNLLSVVPV